MRRALTALTAALCTAVLAAVGGLLTWTLLPLAAGWTPSVVLTGSMAPAVRPGDVVVSAPARPGDALPGRVVVVEDPATARLVVHRVESVTADGSLVTRGDANQSADPAPVTPDAVVGLPRLRVPAVGLPVLWLHEGRWAPVAGTVAALTLAIGVVLVPGAPARHRGAPARRRA